MNSSKGKDLFGFEVKGKAPDGKEPFFSEEDLSAEILNYLASIEASDSIINFSNKSVKKAGRALRRQEGDLKWAESIVRVFRAAHQGPLESIDYIIYRACQSLGISATHAKRLKRLETIVNKLQRVSLDGHSQNQMCITNMNDIGGCRVIVNNISDLERLKVNIKSIFFSTPRLSVLKEMNYITSPKSNDCGYRSLHLIVLYETKESKKFRVEAQLRTLKQHWWSTAVEIIDIIENTKIKNLSHMRNECKSHRQLQWEKLLKITSDLIANEEGAISLTDKEVNVKTIELRGIERDLNAIDRLNSFEMINDQIDIVSKKLRMGQIVLVVDEKEKKVIEKYKITEQKNAAAIYDFLEKTYAEIEGNNVLLVSVESIAKLAKAYPNYVGDCSQFAELLQQWVK